MNKAKQFSVAVMSGLMLMSTPFSSAFARGGSANVGHSFRPSQSGCFRSTLAGVSNTCRSNATWVAQALVDWNRPTDLHAELRNTSNRSRRVSCTARAVGPNGRQVRFVTRSTRVPARQRRNLNFRLHTTHLGSLAVSCELPPRDIVFTNLHYWRR